MTPPGQRLALIVASSEFSDETLQRLVAPGQDAADLARVLKDGKIGGFDQVQVLANRASYEVRREIETFFANRKRDDLLLLYFSGHGVKDDDGRLYLATSDTRRGLFRSTAVPAAFVNETMTASRSRRQVLILDCCHSGAFARGMVAKGGESVDIHDRFEGRGRVVLTASNATQYAFQGNEIIGEGGRSVFTHYLVRGLETGLADLDGDGWVSLDELYDYVYERVTDETPQQTPGQWAFD
ncbi:MAG: caspase family protein, partial [Chloroflexi bacterium]|nr:caspase family protein [Chloroflexota bacterium]